MTIRGRKTVIAVLMSLIMALAYMPCTAFATEGGGGQDVEALQQAMIEAEEVMNQAKTEMDDAEGVMNQAKATWEAKKAAYEKANATATQSEADADNAEQARDDAFAQVKSDAETAYNDAVTAYNNAVSDYETAVSNYDTKVQELSDLQTQKTDLEGEVAELQTQLTAAQQEKATLEAGLPDLEAAVETATNQWNEEIASADAALDAAQSALDGAGSDFINTTINNKNGHDLDEMIAACKTYNTSSFTNPPTDGNGTTYRTIADIANSPNFEKIIDRACTYDNLKKDIDYIREANVHRNLPIHNAGSLKVSYQLMGTAIISAAIDEYLTGHNLINYGDTQWTFWNSGNSMCSSENLAYSPVTDQQGWDPFHGWYYKERMVAVANENGVSVNQDIVDAILAESEENGFPYNPYGSPWNQSQAYFLSHIGTQTGHYESIINSAYKATGFCYVDDADHALSYYPYVASQEFNGDTSASVTVDQYEQELDAWFTGFLADLDDAQAARDALNTKPKAVTDAEAALETRNGEIRTAEQNISTIQGQITTKNGQITDLEGQITEKEGEVATAAATKTEKETAKADALTLKNEKYNAYTEAQNIDMNDPDTYQDYQNLVTAVSNAVTAREKADTDRAAASNAANEANTAQTAYNTAVSDYNTKKSAYDTAAADYNTAKAAYEAAAGIGGGDDPVPPAPTSIDGAKVVLSNTSYTYNGYVHKPTIKTIGGRTLTEGTDYTAVWSNTSSKNAGTYTVTVTGKGGYEGVAKASYKILKATNPMTVKGKTATVKYSKVKKKTQTVKRSAVLYIAKSKGTLKYVKSSGNKKIVISKTTGKVTVKKGIKKGKYKVKVKVTAAGTSNYYKKTLTRTFTIKVK